MPFQTFISLIHLGSRQAVTLLEKLCDAYLHPREPLYRIRPLLVGPNGLGLACMQWWTRVPGLRFRGFRNYSRT